MPKQRPTVRSTKTELIRRALSRKSGACLADLCVATGWQAHSVRAALSRFRKGGYMIERSAPKKKSGGPVYKITRSPEAN